MKTLIIVTHPNIDKSVINKKWLDALQPHQDHVTIHQLHQRYPDGVIDVEAEQKLLLEHDNIVFQFPFYWFSSPPLLKKWLDEVLTHGFADGSDASEKQLTEKSFGLAVSAGIKSIDYDKNGRYISTVEELLRP
ncbi:MAG: NAD(P)H-dependent oxidoreductase, partial [Glaciimonas sp.]|nr:NAD(P)H-dependent oxidoreductase [Glaciimonas sp.]